jgi:hypothetical protein
MEEQQASTTTVTGKTILQSILNNVYFICFSTTGNSTTGNSTTGNSVMYTMSKWLLLIVETYCQRHPSSAGSNVLYIE